MSCVNSKCGKSTDTWDAVLVSCDGDFACSKACEKEFKKQMDHFCSVTLKDDKLFDEWINGE